SRAAISAGVATSRGSMFEGTRSLAPPAADGAPASPPFLAGDARRAGARSAPARRPGAGRPRATVAPAADGAPAARPFLAAAADRSRSADTGRDEPRRWTSATLAGT